MQLKYIILGLFFSSYLSMFSAIIEVTDIKDHADGSFRTACSKAGDGDIISFSKELAIKELLFDSPISSELQKKNITIRSTETIITFKPDFATSSPFVLFDIVDAKNITFENIVFSNGGNDPQIATSKGGAIYFQGESLTLVGCTFSDNLNYEGTGGAIYFFFQAEDGIRDHA